MSSIWYHGSPHRLDILRAGSTITQDRELARIFSHKPPIVTVLDDGSLRHTGTRPGFLHRVELESDASALLPHPGSSMEPGAEWLTLRNLPLRLLEETVVREEEWLTDSMLEALRAAHADTTLGTPKPEKKVLLIYGTKNQAKMTYMQTRISGLPIELAELSGAFSVTEEATESGRFPLENAEEKAFSYWKQLKQPVFSCDSGLHLEGVSDADQPGVWIRRRNGKRMTDEEMIEHYAGLARSHGGALRACYRNAICLVLDETHAIRYEGPDLDSRPFLLVDTPHPRRTDGFPLDALSVELASGRHYHAIEDEAAADKNREMRASDRISKQSGLTSETEEADGHRSFFLRILPLLRHYCPIA